MEIENTKINFDNVYSIVQNDAHIIGKIEACLRDFNNTASLPGFRNAFLKKKIASATYAVLVFEKSEITEEQIAQIQDGKSLPQGKKFLEVEVKKMLRSQEDLYKEIVVENRLQNITPEFLKRVHFLTTDNLSGPGKNLAASNEKEEGLNGFCQWLNSDNLKAKVSTELDAFIKAIATHIYVERVQPFSTSNRQTSHLLEFCIMLNGGIPWIAACLLPVYYFETRTKYRRRLEIVKETGDISAFVEYALQGICDGLEGLIDAFQAQQVGITWQHYTNSRLSSDENAGAKVTTRRKELITAFPMNIDDGLTFEQILILNPSIARTYAKRAKTARRDLAALIELGLLNKRKKKYYLNIVSIMGEMALKSSLVKLEVVAKKETSYSHHVLPKVGGLELRENLLQTLSELHGGNNNE
jgi:Fic family protein